MASCTNLLHRISSLRWIRPICKMTKLLGFVDFFFFFSFFFFFQFFFLFFSIPILLLLHLIYDRFPQPLNHQNSFCTNHKLHILASNSLYIPHLISNHTGNSNNELYMQTCNVPRLYVSLRWKYAGQLQCSEHDMRRNIYQLTSMF